jgi:hypothetical protein
VCVATGPNDQCLRHILDPTNAAKYRTRVLSLGSWPERFRMNGYERFRRSEVVAERHRAAAAGSECGHGGRQVRHLEGRNGLSFSSGVVQDLPCVWARALIGAGGPVNPRRRDAH